MQPTVNKTPRIEVVDALRGFAVMAILLVHSVEHFIFPVYPTDSPEWLNILDNGTFNVIFSLFAGKSYAIFALLFGFTFYIQCHNQQKKGKDFWLSLSLEISFTGGLCHAECSLFPCRRCSVAFLYRGNYPVFSTQME